MVKYLLLSVVLCTIADLNFQWSGASSGRFCNAADTIKANDINDLVVTSAEKEALEKFKETVMPVLVEDFMKTDFYLLRWLRVRGLDLKQAEDFLLQNLRWRKNNNMTQILSEDFSDVKALLPAAIHTHDKMKRPVVAIALGKWKLEDSAIKANILRAHRYYGYLFENVMHEILKAQASGANLTRAVVLVDLEGLNLFSANGMSILLRMQTTLEAYYPRFWEEIIFINAPSGSSMMWMSMRTLLSKESQEIMKMFDNKKPAWSTYLDQRIDREQRYKNFGGTKSF